MLLVSLGRLFAASDDLFCAFTGSLTNLPQLRQRYGLDKSVGEVTLLMEAYKALRDRRPYPPDQVRRPQTRRPG